MKPTITNKADKKTIKSYQQELERLLELTCEERVSTMEIALVADVAELGTSLLKGKVDLGDERPSLAGMFWNTLRADPTLRAQFGLILAQENPNPSMVASLMTKLEKALANEWRKSADEFAGQ